MRGRRPSPVVVTGCQRSGNTWLGKMLAAGPGTRELYQPFNGSIMRPPEPLIWPFRQWKFTWVEEANEDPYLVPARQVLRPRIPVEYPLWELQRAVRTRDVKVCWDRFLANSRSILRARTRKERPVFGDPGSIFLAGWLARRFDAKILVLHRHPAGIAAGYKRMGWVEDMSCLLEQPYLLAGPLAEHEDDLRAFVHDQEAGRADWLQQAIWWWRVFHALHLYQAPHTPMKVVSFEQLAEAPVVNLKALYGDLGLVWDADTEAVIRTHTEGDAATPAQGELHVLRRDTRSIAWAWQHRLSADEICRVRSLTEPWVERFALDVPWPDARG